MKQQTQNDKIELEENNIADIEIFFDEIEPEKECNYLILGALFIHSKNKEKIINQLLDFRCQNLKKKKWDLDYSSCPNKDNCKPIWHNINNTEIHFNQIRESRSSKSQIEISKSWLNFFINKNLVYVSILYIDLNKLDLSFFGNERINANIYNKFFRTIINYGLKCFFRSYEKINIKNIFYDKKRELERHYFFNNLNYDKIIYESEGNIQFEGKIHFIDSDHKLESEYKSESHLIQLIDIILGAVRQNVFFISKDRLKNKVTRIIRGKLNELKKEYWSLKYFKISFFPKNEIKSVTDLQNNKTYERNDEFYSLMDVELKMPAQETDLSQWS